MTPLEDKLRRAIQAKACEVPPEGVPPLRLSARRRRSSSLAHGGGERGGAPARPGWLKPVASATVVVALIAASVVLSRDLAGQHRPSQRPPAAISVTDQAAAWIAAQVSRSDKVSCDPAMCHAVQADGFPASGLLVLGRGGDGALRSQVIVMTPAALTDVGASFGSRYAPAVIASFGSGAAQTEVRVVAPDGAGAYRSALAKDLDARKLPTAELLQSPAVSVAGPPRRQLLTWRVDGRLLTMISYLTTLGRVSILAFGDSGPGAGAGGLLRSARLGIETNSGRPAGQAAVRGALDVLSQAQAPYGPARYEISSLPGGGLVLDIEYEAPAPLGTINYNG
jgi:hypothetical protein